MLWWLNWVGLRPHKSVIAGSSPAQSTGILPNAMAAQNRFKKVLCKDASGIIAQLGRAEDF